MSQQLPDVQASSPDVTVGLNRVGVTGVEKLVKLGRRDRDPIVLMAEIEVFVDLPSWRKGADMSRNMEVIDETLETAVSEEAYRVEDVCGDAAELLLEKHDYTTKAEVRMEADYVTHELTPESEMATQSTATIIASAKATEDGTSEEIGAQVTGMTVCPCSQGMSASRARQTLRNMAVEDAPGAMEEGRIDASIAYGTAGVRYTGFVTEISSRIDVRYVEPTDALIESAKSFPGAGTTRTPYDEWSLGNQDIGTDEVFTWDLEVNYVFHPDANADAVYELCRVVDEHNDVVNEAEDQFLDFESTEDMLGQMIEGEDFPFHPGAAQYYKDNEVWGNGDYYEA